MLPPRRCDAASSHRAEKAERLRRRARRLWPRTAKEIDLLDLGMRQHKCHDRAGRDEPILLRRRQKPPIEREWKNGRLARTTPMRDHNGRAESALPRTP